MSQELNQVGPAVHVAQVVHHGEKLILPDRMTIKDAIALLLEREKYLEQKTVIKEDMDVFPWEGAYALMKALQRKYGWAQAIPTPGFFGPTPPHMIAVDVAPGKKVEVPWGRFALPGVSGFVQTGQAMIKGRAGFMLAAEVKRNDEQVIRELFAEVRRLAVSESLYLGKAVKMKFLDEDSSKLPIPELEFIDVSQIDVNQLILSEDVLSSVETNLFTPIERIRELRANGISVKRGVLLGGTYGTGKTLAATCASKLAVKHGVTFIYVTRADELEDALKFAQRYQDPGCVVFCEDIDRELDGERSVEMDDLLNIIDGLDTKTSNIIVVLTTNNLDGIHPAMLRPGRLDAVIDVTVPDAKAVEQLIRYYSKDSIEKSTDLAAVGKELEGCIPAIIAEVVKRAKLAELRFTAEGAPISKLSEKALLQAAKTMRRQLDLLNKPLKKEPDGLSAALSKVVANTMNGGGGEAREVFIQDIAKKVVKQLHDSC